MLIAPLHGSAQGFAHGSQGTHGTHMGACSTQIGAIVGACIIGCIMGCC